MLITLSNTPSSYGINHQWLPRHHYQLLRMGIERVSRIKDALDDYG
jgi:hypothetical protein